MILFVNSATFSLKHMRPPHTHDPLLDNSAFVCVVHGSIMMLAANRHYSVRGHNFTKQSINWWHAGLFSLSKASIGNASDTALSWTEACFLSSTCALILFEKL